MEIAANRKFVHAAERITTVRTEMGEVKGVEKESTYTCFGSFSTECPNLHRTRNPPKHILSIDMKTKVVQHVESE